MNPIDDLVNSTLKVTYKYFSQIQSMLSILSFLCGIVGLIISITFYVPNTGSSDIAISGFLTAFGLTLIITRYLEKDNITTKKAKDSLSSTEYLSLLHEIKKVHLETLTTNVGIAEAESLHNHIENTVKNYINDSLTNEELLEMIQEKSENFLKQSTQLPSINFEIDKIDIRIESELQRLTRSSNINLAVGTATTAVAITILLWATFNTKLNFNNVILLLSFYIPRISVLIFVEVFAFFFLKMYRANLVDLKYLHNEKTNIELKMIALRTALLSGNDKNLEYTIQELVKTERNFILKKDESTIDLMREKQQAINETQVFETIKELIKLKK